MIEDKPARFTVDELHELFILFENIKTSSKKREKRNRREEFNKWRTELYRKALDIVSSVIPYVVNQVTK